MKFEAYLEDLLKQFKKSGHEVKLNAHQGVQADTFQVTRKGSKNKPPVRKFIKSGEIQNVKQVWTARSDRLAPILVEIIAYELVSHLNQAVGMGFAEGKKFGTGLKIPIQNPSDDRYWEYDKVKKRINILTSAYTKIKDVSNYYVDDLNNLNVLFIFALVGWSDMHAGNRVTKANDYYVIDAGLAFDKNSDSLYDLKSDLDDFYWTLKEQNKKLQKKRIETLIWWQHFIQNNIIKRKIFNKIIESKINKLEKATGKKFTSLRNSLLQFLMTNSSQILREINKTLKKVNS
jgi:hypothetical protein